MKDNNNNEQILDSLAEGIFTVDTNFRIKFFNKAAEEMLGFKKDRAIGQFCKNVFNSEFCSMNCPIASVLQTGKSIFDFESYINCINGKNLPIKLNAAVLKDESNEPVGGVVSFRDISSFKEITKFLENHSHFYGIVGKSRQMQEIFKLIEEISETDATVFIHGETGSGKELIADAIFETSRRKQKKFVKVNCSVLPGQLLASELFGHAKGAFTDAVKDRIGRFEFADEGTILLDEVAEMPLQMQSQLLRVIQEGTFERLGESVTRKVNVRILAATNMNIELALESGKFREDLFYRLNVIPIHLPPLRNRKEDIPFLLDHFLKKYSLLYKKNSFEFDDSVMDVFNSYDWPGNVRELENVVEYTVIRSKEGMRISVCSLPLHLRKLTDCKKKIDPDLKNSIEYSQLLKLLEQYRWNKTKVAEVLGVNRTTIWRKLKSIGIE